MLKDDEHQLSEISLLIYKNGPFLEGPNPKAVDPIYDEMIERQRRDEMGPWGRLIDDILIRDFNLANRGLYLPMSPVISPESIAKGYFLLQADVAETRAQALINRMISAAREMTRKIFESTRAKNRPKYRANPFTLKNERLR
jgi:hypothetical protein